MDGGWRALKLCYGLLAQAAARAGLSGAQLDRSGLGLVSARAATEKAPPAASTLGQLAEHGQPTVHLAGTNICRPSDPASGAMPA